MPMGATSVGAGHSGDCPSSLLPDGVPLPAGDTGDPTVYISAGDGVLLPECCTRTMEGRLRWCSTLICDSSLSSLCLLYTSHTISPVNR